MNIGVSFRQLQVYVTVAKLGTIGAAAQRLNLSQSATSQSLSELERHLNVPLFERTGRRLVLTEVGLRQLSHAEALLDGLQRFVEGAQEPDGIIQGNLLISASSTIGTYRVPFLIDRFSDLYPGVSLQARLRNTEEVLAEVSRLEADIGLIEGPCTDERLMTEYWCDDELVIVCGAEHPLARVGRIDDAGIATQPWIIREAGSGTRSVLESAISGHAQKLNIRMELGQSEAIREAVRAGYGLACLSKLSVIEDLRRGSLVELKSSLNLKRAFHIVWHPQRYQSPAWQALKVFLRERAAEYMMAESVAGS
ncbi:LysR family transcriptional regulator [Pseudomonas sp. P66]|jgi:DNA-binding transcriptional LysR family regulator|uniref:LysR family transcriptional regulator n=1 Tax=Pseudomonas arcuscaelestis TaxID=2710591 RepID=A0ABS2C1T6_9PSED|nr:LysR substrate-binding domain-containing protein [Pseudomonas arcuscaelestis]MBM5459855.1 LysR family transcriptional regulator [Pseudomonas arcuscaelestis]